MKITKSFEFTPEERTILKERILGMITEAEASRRLKVPRQTVNSLITRLVMMEAKEGRYNVC